MQTETLTATKRKTLGSKHTRRLRGAGKCPAVIYGHGEDPETITLEQHEVEVALLHHSRLLELNIEGSARQYLIKAVQYDHLGSTPLHLDLMRVSADERVEVKVEVVLKGVPKGAHEGGILMQLINDLEIECPVTGIPNSIRGDVSNLNIDDMLTVGDLILPPGVKALVDADERVAVVQPPAVEQETEEEPVEGEAETSAEPEIIGRKKEDDEEGGD